MLADIPTGNMMELILQLRFSLPRWPFLWPRWQETNQHVMMLFHKFRVSRLTSCLSSQNTEETCWYSSPSGAVKDLGSRDLEYHSVVGSLLACLRMMSLPHSEHFLSSYVHAKLPAPARVLQMKNCMLRLSFTFMSELQGDRELFSK